MLQEQFERREVCVCVLVILLKASLFFLLLGLWKLLMILR